MRKNKNIHDTKKLISEEKRKIKILKKDLRKQRINKFKATKVGKLLFIFSNEREAYSFSDLFVVTLVSLVVGAFACFSIFTIFTGGRNYFKLSRDLGKFFDVYDTLTENYYGDVSVDELVESAISGMVSSVGDVYTSYADSEYTESFNELIDGKYEGIGCTIQQIEKEIKVISIYDGGPADKAGLKVNDIIKSVDEYDANEMGATALSEYIKNEATNDINIVVYRDGEEISFNLIRDEVEIPVVESKVINDNDAKIGYLKISIFSSVSSNQFEKRLEELEKENIDSLIIDVRDNSGGYLSSVTDIVSYLMPKGDVIYKIQKNDNIESVKDKTTTKREYPIAVLVNGNSASASEILAGAIKDSYGGFVVGNTTYGKGTVQQVKKLSDGSMIKYTVENWLTPNGTWIDGEGIVPTHLVDLDQEYYENPIDENDKQLKKAIELVSN